MTVVLGRTTKRGKWTVLGRARGVAAFDLHRLLPGHANSYWHCTRPEKLAEAMKAGDVTTADAATLGQS